MEEKQLFIYFLSQFDLPANKVEYIISCLKQDVSFSNFCKLKFDDKIISKQNLEKMLPLADEKYAKAYLENLECMGIKLTCKLDKDYPKKFLNLPDAPFFLFYKGDLSLLDKTCLAVVGTRLPSNYGRMVTNKFVCEIAKHDVVIVSGLAYGIDSIAHRKTLEVGGKTIAVLGSGLNNIYPAEHIDLAKQIAEKGLLISEYCPSTKATKYTFPTRNRLIAGACEGVLIVEAGLKSGTLYTRDYALDYGKDVFAVPGNIDSEKSSLPNEIICSGQGMGVSDPNTILKQLNVDIKKTKPKVVLELSFEENIVYKFLESGTKDFEFLEKNCNLPINILNSCLTMMEIRGIISRMPGGMFCLK